MPNTKFEQKVSIAYMKFVLNKSYIPAAEFFEIYEKLSAVPELENLSLVSIHEKSRIDELTSSRPNGNIHFEANYLKKIGVLEQMTNIVRKRTGLTLDDPIYWVNQRGRGDFLYRFPDGINIAKVILNPYTSK